MDPIRDGANWFAYVNNDPVNYVDLWGLLAGEPERGFWSKVLDGVQTGLDVVGFVPGFGEIADGINALISLGRGDVAGAALSAMSMVPVWGDAVGKGGKIARAAIKHGDKVLEAGTKLLDDANVTKKIFGNAPPANNGVAPRHGSIEHDARIQQKLGELSAEGVNMKNVRKNQQQVDANGNKVGTNRPDLQWTDSEGKRHYWEIDRSKSSSIKHGETIQRNDPSGIVHLEILE